MTTPNEDSAAPDREFPGYAVIPDVLDRTTLERVIGEVHAIHDPRVSRNRGGVYAVRNLLSVCGAVQNLARSSAIACLVRRCLGDAAFPVQATLFDKTPQANWLVPWHQDLTIAVHKRIDTPGYGPWTIKAGVVHTQATARVLDRMLAVRIHIDDCGANNGPLRVLPDTHKLGRLDAREVDQLAGSILPVACTTAAGGVVLMKPLLLHASSPAATAAHRRVIHIDFAATYLDGSLEWAFKSPNG